MADQDRQAHLVRLGDALHAASTAADWPRLGMHVRALDGQLRTLAAQGPWTAAEKAALTRLRVQHDQAAANVAGTAQALALRMQELRTNQEGWIAYAAHSETQDGASRKES